MKKYEIFYVDDAGRRAEDASYALDILTRCAVSKDGVGKKQIKIVPFKQPGEPLIVSVPLSQVKCMYLLNYIFCSRGIC